MKPFEEIPFETRPTDKRGYEIFKTTIWWNRELCNQCFTTVRNIGPVMERWMGASYMTMNEWYERTENGSQEFTPFDENRRYGTCFCTNCGSDCTGDHTEVPLSDLINLVENVFRYTAKRTDHDLDARTFGREARELNTSPAAQHHGTELIAIAFARALESDNAEPRTTTPQGHEATAD